MVTWYRWLSRCLRVYEIELFVISVHEIIGLTDFGCN